MQPLEVPKKKKQRIIASHCHSPSFDAGSQQEGKGESSRAPTPLLVIPQNYAALSALPVTSSKRAKQGKKGLAAAELGHLRAGHRDLEAELKSHHTAE